MRFTLPLIALLQYHPIHTALSFAIPPFGTLPRLSHSLPQDNAHLHSSSCLSSSASCTDVDTASSSPLTTTSGSQTTILATDEEYTKPDPDTRLYRAVKLANGLKVLLVSDDKTDVEAGSVHVNAGHFNDPADRAGLAHFHEHMLFLGTEKYPEENDYESYLSKNGGSTNAYTDMEDTNYYFSVTPGSNTLSSSSTSPALEGALDRLAQFMISPLFKEEAVERELRAVDSEYVNGMSQDAWRQYQLLKSWCNPDHPFHKFGCGNYNTLTNGGIIKNNSSFTETGGTSPRPALLQFWSDHYHAGNIQLCVLGRASLDSLQQTVETYFNDVRPSPSPSEKTIPSTNGDTSGVLFSHEHTRYNHPAFSSNNLGKIHHVIPLTERRTLRISFATPPGDDPTILRSRPHRAVSHLLGHESPGSLHALLSDLGYINGLSSGSGGVDTSDFSLFGITIGLTPLGREHMDKVLDLTFQWLALVKTAWEEDKMAAYHEELRQMSDVNFKFREVGDPVDFVQSAADLLGRFPAKDILVAGITCGDYDKDVTGAILDRLVPSNALITVYDKDFEKEEDGEGEWKEERWYRGKYRTFDMEEVVKRWMNPTQIDERLHLPKLNEFIATDFSLRCDSDEFKDIDDDDTQSQPTNGLSETNSPNDDDTTTSSVPSLPTPPEVLIDTPKLRLWHKMDRTYRVPRTYIRLLVTTPNVYRSARAMTLNRLYQRVLNDDLNSFVYDAGLAGCGYKVACTPTGYSVAVSGYSQKLPVLLDVLTSRMLSLLSEMKKDPEERDPLLTLRFEKAKINLLRETKNFKLDAPYETANYNARVLMEETAWHLDSYIEELEQGLEIKECADLVEECLTGPNKIEALCMGNISPEEANEVGDVITSHFSKAPLPLRRDEIPVYKSLQVPLSKPQSTPSHTIVQQLAHMPSEENHALEFNMQVGSDATLGYRGVAIMELIGYLAYNSAFGQLRTKEQLGYIVSAFIRKTAGGARCLTVVIQGGAATPQQAEERVENWLTIFRKELEEMSEEDLEQESAAIAAQLLERDMSLGDEVGRFWGEIAVTGAYAGRLRHPVFDRVERLAEEFTGRDMGDMKQDMLQFFDRYLVRDAPERRVVSSRVYNRKEGEGQKEFEKNGKLKGVLVDWNDVVELKQFLGSWAVAPYWEGNDYDLIGDVDGDGDD